MYLFYLNMYSSLYVLTFMFLIFIKKKKKIKYRLLDPTVYYWKAWSHMFI